MLVRQRAQMTILPVFMRQRTSVYRMNKEVFLFVEENV
jgi:hypothetical protein